MGAAPLPAWAQRCSCGGQGITHLHAEHHEPVGPADVDPYAGRACGLCGDYTTGPCPTCAPGAIAAVARVRDLHRKANNGETCVYCAHGQRVGYDTTWPCDTIRALDGAHAEGVPDAAAQQ